MIEIRNSFVHGLIYPGHPDANENWDIFPDNLDYNLFSLEHHKLSAKGFNRNEQILSINDLKDFTSQIMLLYECLLHLRFFHGYKDISAEREEFLREISENLKKVNFKFNPLPNRYPSELREQ